jgi:hypothetical protein
VNAELIEAQAERIRALEAVLREIVATKEDGTISAASLRTIARKALGSAMETKADG